MSEMHVHGLPTQQDRSRRTREKLVRAGQTLLQDRTLQEISIAEIAREAGVATGSFYRRFSDKDTFEVAVLEEALREGKELIQAVYEKHTDVFELAVEVAQLTIERHVEFAPIYRAAILRAYQNPGDDTPARRHGRFLINTFLERAQKLLGRALTASEQRRITMSFQILFGAVINALLGRPGPYMIEDAEFKEEITLVFSNNIRLAFNDPAQT